MIGCKAHLQQRKTTLQNPRKVNSTPRSLGLHALSMLRGNLVIMYAHSPSKKPNASSGIRHTVSHGLLLQDILCSKQLDWKMNFGRSLDSLARILLRSPHSPLNLNNHKSILQPSYKFLTMRTNTITKDTKKRGRIPA